MKSFQSKENAIYLLVGRLSIAQSVVLQRSCCLADGISTFDGDAARGQQLNSHDSAKALFDDLAPGKRFSGEAARAQHPRDVTEQWFKKLLAGDDMFSPPYSTTLSEWRDGRIVGLPSPKSAR